MKRETVIGSSYEAAFLVSLGLDYRMVPRPNSHDVDFAFPAGKQLDEARKRFEEDVDLLEFIERHRRVKWSIWKALKARDTNDASRSTR